MPHMANFVYQYYMDRVKALKMQYEVSFQYLNVNLAYRFFNNSKTYFFFQETQKTWEKPGDLKKKSHEGLIASHPGEDRDTDSEDEKDEPAKGQLPVPIQDEPVEATPAVVPEETVVESSEDVPVIEEQDEEMMDADEPADSRSEVMDTGEVANDEQAKD